MLEFQAAPGLKSQLILIICSPPFEACAKAAAWEVEHDLLPGCPRQMTTMLNSSQGCIPVARMTSLPAAQSCCSVAWGWLMEAEDLDYT